ncbi:hypothetical protein QA584_04670 [Anaerocolumna sp. AGMB13025]|uniref:hypothetical protein n=1 Tax=Anaerocolumna sp. AGMB13025 TaxID=3039116 RepID=UPI00241C5BC7|nr:hypothetical protein [Anaerocolumna sp. AGMB13025]WFR58367.1 hypothetical protein QA584_04670 [Anaerocolumna sp. AGMB13025]
MSRIILEDNSNNGIETDKMEEMKNKIEEKPVTEKYNRGSQPITDEFAVAFPDWNLVPPLQVIKRVRRSL